MLRPRWWLAVLAIVVVTTACASKTSTGGGPTPTGTIVASEAGGSSSASGSPSGEATTRWKATMQTHSELNQVNPSALICRTVYTFVFDLLVTSGGTVTGSGDADLKDVPACPHQYNTVIVENISFRVSGKMTSDGFTLTATPTGSFKPGGSIDITGTLISLSGDATSGTFTVKAPFSDASHTLAHDEFPRRIVAGSGIYTSESSLVIVPA